MARRRVVANMVSLWVLHTCLCSAQEAVIKASAEITDKGDTIPLTTKDVTSTTHVSNDALTNTSYQAVNQSMVQQETTDQKISSTAQLKGAKSDPVQSGPLVSLFGPRLLSLDMVDATHAELRPHYTSDALRGKKVIGVYFSADWCGPCRKFTPELVSFYQKMNQRRGQKDQFEIVWVSRCRDVDSYGKFFAHMGGWMALPPEEAMGDRGTMLSNKFKVKGIPTLVLLDDLGEVITRDGRNKIPQDKAGIGFPWRNPLAKMYMTLLPRSLRFLVRSQVESLASNVKRRLQKIGKKPVSILAKFRVETNKLS